MNNVGFHDQPFVFDLPDSVRRIGFFGDSFVEATQVDADSTFVSLFEDLANASGRRVDAAAFGIIGSGADQELFRCLSATQQARFDEVVYVFSRNDFFDGVGGKENGVGEKGVGRRDKGVGKKEPPSWPFLERDSLGAYYFSGALEPGFAGGSANV